MREEGEGRNIKETRESILSFRAFFDKVEKFEMSKIFSAHFFLTHAFLARDSPGEERGG